MTISDSAQPTPLPIPSDFPVVWENPDDEKLLWKRDRMHRPDQVPPLENSLAEAGGNGFEKAAAYYGIPMRGRSLYINTYSYGASLPPPQPVADPAAQGKAIEEKMRTAVAKHQARWENEWLPEVKEHLAWWETFDLQGVSDAALVAHLDETIKRIDRIWEIHFLVVFPMRGPSAQLAELYVDLFPDGSEFDAYEMLQGFSNLTVKSGSELWALSRKALGMPDVLAALAEADTANVIAELRESEAGADFLTDLNEYLDVYGRRGDKWGIAYKSWIEDPTPVLNNLRDYISQPARDLAAELQAQAAQRDKRIAETRAALQGYPQPVIGQFEGLLAAAQFNTILSEDHGYWIDFRATYEYRRVIMECGRRLAQSHALDDADDIFMLELSELRESLLHSPHLDRREIAAKRRAVMDRFATVEPPLALGTPPPDSTGPPDSSVGRMMSKMGGGPPAPSDDPGVVNGNAGSPGIVRGPAKIIRSLSDAQRLQPGDILVTETTAPSWTPLFATVAAVVTDTGGILSHCAVVAREYGIPAVVGTQRATQAIQDGQTVEVDGTAGVVRIIA